MSTLVDSFNDFISEYEDFIPTRHEVQDGYTSTRKFQQAKLACGCNPSPFLKITLHGSNLETRSIGSYFLSDADAYGTSNGETEDYVDEFFDLVIFANRWLGQTTDVLIITANTSLTVKVIDGNSAVVFIRFISDEDQPIR